MYTDCPNCGKEFEILAAHLKAAHGMVRCGQCQHEFNALSRLYDEPKIAREIPVLQDEVFTEDVAIKTEEVLADNEQDLGKIDADEMLELEESEQIDSDIHPVNTIADFDEEDSEQANVDEAAIDENDVVSEEIEAALQEDDNEVESSNDDIGTETNTEEIEVTTEFELQAEQDEQAQITIEDAEEDAEPGTAELLEKLDNLEVTEKVTLDEDNVEEIEQGVQQFKMMLGEVDDTEDEDIDEEDETPLANQFDTSQEEDPEFKALTELLDEVNDFIPDPDAQPQFNLGEENTKTEEPELLLTDSSDLESSLEEKVSALPPEETLSVNSDEIDVINQAIDRLQDKEEVVDVASFPTDLDEELKVAPEPLPELLQEEMRKTNYWMLTFWTLISLLAILIGLFQLLWFNRDALLEQYPQYYPQAKQICEQINAKEIFDCKLRRYKNLPAIQIKERDVRLHPEFENTLLINASMVNTAEFTQDFPGVQLLLFGDNNERIAHVEILPDDYLDNSIDKKSGMQPSVPVHFILEVNGKIESADSFEFHFF